MGKLSGAVGTYSNIDPRVEAHVCAALGLHAGAGHPGRRPRPPRRVPVGLRLGRARPSSMIATEIRHLQRTEVGEVAEPFRAGQKGSSAMPHKRNPITCERLAGLARVLRGNLGAGLEDVALWHERDISHSSVERVILPDSSLLAYYLLVRMTRVVDGLTVDADRMLENLDRSYGLVFSQPVLLALVASGLTRDDAYRIVQDTARTAHTEPAAVPHRPRGRRPGHPHRRRSSTRPSASSGPSPTPAPSSTPSRRSNGTMTHEPRPLGQGPRRLRRRRRPPADGDVRPHLGLRRGA